MNDTDLSFIDNLRPESPRVQKERLADTKFEDYSTFILHRF